MAQKVQVQLLDDIDESEATETVEFGLDGTRYEIDLNGLHAEELRKSVAEYVDHARKASSVRATGRRPTRADAAVIRERLIELGWAGDLKEKGRIPGHLVAVYEAGTRKPTATEAPPELPPEVDAKVTEVITEAKDGVKERRNRRKAAVAAHPANEHTVAPAATKATASVPASPTAEAPTKPLKRPTQRGAQRKGAGAAKDAAAEADTTTAM